MPGARPLVEVAVDTLAAALVAAGAGADRIELCQALEVGGTTPSAGLLSAVKASVAIPVFVMIRPRGGDFVYAEPDEEVMLRDIESAAGLGADGIVLGALTVGGTPDLERVARLVQRARPLPVTFHRAFDGIPNPREALGPLRAAGVDRILTSGGAATAYDGRFAIERLVTHAPASLVVMAGGGVSGDTVTELIRRTGVAEVHLAGSYQVPSAARSGELTTVPNPARVLRVVEAVRALAA
jgi:copper homeostasis protein